MRIYEEIKKAISGMKWRILRQRAIIDDAFSPNVGKPQEAVSESRPK
ncbi:MAG: hypothetical protein ABSF91_16205 [Bacteroidota bacterium]|jgi:hypothetical protein